MLGLVTIGQSPRADFQRTFEAHAPGVKIKLVGALDGMPVEEVDRLAAIPGDYLLHLLLADGSIRNIQRDVLHPLVEERIHGLAAEGVEAVVLLCTGAFDEVRCGVPVLLAGRLVPAVAGAIATTRRIGVVTPIEPQLDAARAKWEAHGFDVKMAWASPHRREEMAAAAEAMSDRDLELVVLDCMSHSAAYRDEFAGLSGRPVLLAQTLVARVAGELVGGG